MPVESTLRLFSKAQSKAGEWYNHWDDIARVMNPRRLGFNTQVTTGDSRVDEIFDGTPMRAARFLANSIAGFMRPEGQQWIFIRVDDEAVNASEEAQLWLTQAENELQQEIYEPRAKFRQASGETDFDLVSLGTGIIWIGENKRQDGLLFQSVYLRDGAVLWDEDDDLRAVFRRRSMTVLDAADRYGKGSLSSESQKKLESEDGKTAKVTILHAAMRRPGGREDAMFARNMPWMEEVIEVDAKHMIREGGFMESPYIVPRWDTTSGEGYGRSPGMIALPDANTLQAMGETLLVSGQRAADPPLMAPNDGSFSEVRAFPGGLGYYDVETAVQLGGNPFFPLETGSNMPLTRDMQQDLREQTFDAFFRNVLNLPLDRPEMTATEVLLRKQEFIREIGPVFGRLESDYTAPMVERAFSIMLRAGAFPPIPEILSGQRVVFEYDSPVTRELKQVQAQTAAIWAQEAAAFGEIDPRAGSVPNYENIVRFSHEALNLPLPTANSRDQVDAEDQARQEAEQQALQAQAIDSVVNTADVAAGALGKATDALQPEGTA